MSGLTGITGLFTGLNWEALALKAAVVIIVLGATFGAGFHFGEQSVVKPLATSIANIAPQAAKAQSDKTSADAKANQADSKARAGAQSKRDAAVAAVKATPSLLTPVPKTAQGTICPAISTEAMDKLNDPDIIGKDAQ